MDFHRWLKEFLTIRAVLRTLGALPGFIGAAASTYQFGATLCETKTIAQACVSMGAACACSIIRVTWCVRGGRAARIVAG